MFSDFIRHPLFLLIVGAIFSWSLSRWWQARQRQGEIRTQLVGDMAECIMNFDTPLKEIRRSIWRCISHPGIQTEDTSDDPAEALKPCRTAFDVKRCVLHTKLEAYFPSEPWIEREWTRLALDFLSLSESEVVTSRTAETFSEAEKDWLRSIAEVQSRAADKAPLREDEVGPEWAYIEELLLAEKVRLISAVRHTPMQDPSRLHRRHDEAPSRA